jgi:hypothetical protein
VQLWQRPSALLLWCVLSEVALDWSLPWRHNLNNMVQLWQQQSPSLLRWCRHNRVATLPPSMELGFTVATSVSKWRRRANDDWSSFFFLPWAVGILSMHVSPKIIMWKSISTNFDHVFKEKLPTIPNIYHKKIYFMMILMIFIGYSRWRQIFYKFGQSLQFWLIQDIIIFCDRGSNKLLV